MYSISEEFLQWLDSELGWLTTGVYLFRTAERSAELSAKHQNIDTSVSDYNALYSIQTRAHPQFERYRSWYRTIDTDGTGTGTESDTRRQKHVPSLSLTPIDAKMWYVCDGSLAWQDSNKTGNPIVEIGARVRIKDGTADELCRMFERSTLGISPTIASNVLRFSVSESQRFLDWIGDPVPGFAYKWEYDSYERYRELFDAVH
jgi:hypothetical protein